MSDTPVDGTESYSDSCRATVSSSDNSLEAIGERSTVPIDCVTGTVDSSTPDSADASDVLMSVPPSHGTQALGGIGGWTTLSGGAVQTLYPQTILDNVLLIDTPNNELVRSQSYPEEPFSLVNPVDSNDHIPDPIPRFLTRPRVDLDHTAHFMLQVITRKMAECSDHIENVCDPMTHRHIETRLNEVLFGMVVLMAMVALSVLGIYGVRLVSTLFYFFLMLFAVVLAIARLL